MILETIASAFVGLLGTSLTTYSNYKMEKLRYDNKIAELKLQSQLMIAEVEANIKVAQATSDMLVEKEEAVAFVESQKSNKQALPSNWIDVLLNQKGVANIFTLPIGVVLLFLLGIGDVIQHVMRSLLTVYSLAIASWVTYQSWSILDKHGYFDPLSMTDSWKSACEVVMLLAVTMVTWWFGDRRVATHLMHMKGGK